MDERRRALHIDIADDTGGKYPLRGDTEKRYENEKKLIMYKLFDNSHEIEEKKRNQKNEFGVGYHKDFVHENTSRYGGCTALYTAFKFKHRKNCECCPGHYLIVNHYSSMS